MRRLAPTTLSVVMSVRACVLSARRQNTLQCRAHTHKKTKTEPAAWEAEAEKLTHTHKHAKKWG
jgi:hypothetical protein